MKIICTRAEKEKIFGQLVRLACPLAGCPHGKTCTQCWEEAIEWEVTDEDNLHEDGKRESD